MSNFVNKNYQYVRLHDGNGNKVILNDGKLPIDMSNVEISVGNLDVNTDNLESLITVVGDNIRAVDSSVNSNLSTINSTLTSNLEVYDTQLKSAVNESNALLLTMTGVDYLSNSNFNSKISKLTDLDSTLNSNLSTINSTLGGTLTVSNSVLSSLTVNNGNLEVFIKNHEAIPVSGSFSDTDVLNKLTSIEGTLNSNIFTLTGVDYLTGTDFSAADLLTSTTFNNKFQVDESNNILVSDSNVAVKLNTLNTTLTSNLEVYDTQLKNELITANGYLFTLTGVDYLTGTDLSGADLLTNTTFNNKVNVDGNNDIYTVQRYKSTGYIENLASNVSISTLSFTSNAVSVAGYNEATIYYQDTSTASLDGLDVYVSPDGTNYLYFGNFVPFSNGTNRTFTYATVKTGGMSHIKLYNKSTTDTYNNCNISVFAY